MKKKRVSYSKVSGTNSFKLKIADDGKCTIKIISTQAVAGYQIIIVSSVFSPISEIHEALTSTAYDLNEMNRNDY